VKVEDLVFIDEFGAATNMARTHGRGPKGQRVVDKVPHGHWKTLSTVAALSVKGILTAVSYDGAMNGECFVGFIEQFLVPTLRPGQVVIMDNLPAHKSAEVDRLIEAAGAKVLRLPPYSPDFNPIEMAISKTKTLLRKEAARTVQTLINAVGRCLSAITPDDAEHYIRHCGYGATLN
jgi:transposase